MPSVTPKQRGDAPVADARVLRQHADDAMIELVEHRRRHVIGATSKLYLTTSAAIPVDTLLIPGTRISSSSRKVAQVVEVAERDQDLDVARRR